MVPSCIEELKTLKRKELQALAKIHGVKANQSSEVLTSELQDILFSKACSNVPSVNSVLELPPLQFEPIIVATKEVKNVMEIIPVENDNIEIIVGIEVEVLINLEWKFAVVKRVNKNSYRVIIGGGVEQTVKPTEIRLITHNEVDNTASLVPVAVNDEHAVLTGDVSFLQHEEDALRMEEQVADVLESSMVLEAAVEESLRSYSSRLSSSRLSFCMHDTAQDFECEEDVDGDVNEDSFDTCDDGTTANRDRDEVEEEDFAECSFIVPTALDCSIDYDDQQLNTSIFAINPIIEETSPAIAAEELSMYIDAEVDRGDDEAPLTSLQVPATATKKVLKFSEAENPFSSLVKTTPYKSRGVAVTNNKASWRGSTKPTVSASQAVLSQQTSTSSGMSSALPRTPKSTMSQKPTMSTTPRSALVPTVTSAVNGNKKQPVLVPRLTKAQQMREIATKQKLEEKSKLLAEETARNASFQFADATLNAPLSVANAAAAAAAAAQLVSTVVVPPTKQSVLPAAAVKTPLSVGVAHNARKNQHIHASAVAGSAKRKLQDVVCPSSTSSMLNTQHSKDGTQQSAKKTKSSAPDFARMHSNQFNNSKSIASMVNRNKSISVKMTHAMDEALNKESSTSARSSIVKNNIGGAAPVVLASKVVNNTKPVTATAGTSIKKSDVESTAGSIITPAVLAPTTTAHSVVRKHVSMLVPQIAAVNSAQKAPIPVLNSARTSLMSTKTPSKRSTFGTADKENAPMSVRNKFVNSRRRASAMDVNVKKGPIDTLKTQQQQAVAVEMKREVRRNSFLEESKDKRRQSVCRTRKSSILDCLDMSVLDSVHETIEEGHDDNAGEAGIVSIHQQIAPLVGPFSASVCPDEY